MCPFLSVPDGFLPLVLSFAALLITLLPGCWYDIRERAVPVVLWYPMLLIAVPSTLWFYYSMFTAGWGAYLIPVLVMVVFFSIAFFLFTCFHLFGMADAKALIFITLFIPCFPFVPICGYSYMGIPPFVFFPFSVLVNAVLLNLLVPAGILVYNIAKGNRAPLRYMVLGFPVPGAEIENQFGIIMEEIKQTDSGIEHRFIGMKQAICDMIRGSKTRIYTKNLKEEPETYRDLIQLYHGTGSIWISYGVPFLIPITAGLFTAAFFGDIFTIILGSFL